MLLESLALCCSRTPICSCHRAEACIVLNSSRADSRIDGLGAPMGVLIDRQALQVLASADRISRPASSALQAMGRAPGCRWPHTSPARSCRAAGGRILSATGAVGTFVCLASPVEPDGVGVSIAPSLLGEAVMEVGPDSFRVRGPCVSNQLPPAATPPTRSGPFWFPSRTRALPKRMAMGPLRTPRAGRRRSQEATGRIRLTGGRAAPQH